MAEKAIKQRARRLFEMQDVEVKTRSVEEMLLPLIKQVTTLQENIPGSTRKKKLRNVFRLIQIVDKATDNFTTAAENIATDNPEFQEELWLAIEEVQTSGNFLHEAAHEYSSDVLAARKREAMEERAAGLLKAVTRLLVLIDLIDINELFKASSKIEAKLQNLKQAQTWEMFVESMKGVAKDIREVSETAIARQKELKNSAAKQLMVAAHTELSQQARMLITSTKTFLQHPNDESAAENRDYTINRLSEVLKTIARLADGDNPDDIQKELDNDDSDLETTPPPNYNSIPSSPIHPPSSHLYPIEYHVSPPILLPNTIHLTNQPIGTSQSLSSDDEHSFTDNHSNRKLPHRNQRVSGEFDHLRPDSRRESQQYDQLDSQDTYSSSSSFSLYNPEDDASLVDSKEHSLSLTGQTTSKIYQVSSGTLPTEQSNSTSTHDDIVQGNNSGDHTNIEITDAAIKGQTSVSGKNSNKNSSLHITKSGGTSSGQSYPRGHTHSSKITATSVAVGNHGVNMIQPNLQQSHQSFQKGHEHFVLSSSSTATGHGHSQSSKMIGLSVPHKQHLSSSYPRGHTHLKGLQLSPTKAMLGGLGGASVSITSPPKCVEKSIERFETMLEQTAASSTDPPPAAEKTVQLQAGFDTILTAASIIAESDSTRDQHGLLAQCDVVREKLQNLLKVITTDDMVKNGLMLNGEDTSQGTESVVSDDTVIDERGEGDGSEDDEEGGRPLRSSTASSGSRNVRRSVQMVEEETATLRAELRKAMIEHVSDTFVDPCIPLTRMVVAAKQGNRRNVDNCSEQFLIHADKLVHVSNLVCSLTSDGPANRDVRMAAKPIESLKNQIVSAAKTLVGHPDSESALKNMTAFQDLWIEKVTALTESVDKVIPLQDFIAVTEAHIREDSRRVVEAVETINAVMSTGCSNVIQGRCDRLVQVVNQDMIDHASRYAPEYAEALENAMERLTEKTLPNFQAQIQSLNKKHSKGKVYDSDIRNLEDHLQNINDDIRDIRIYILRTRTKEELKAEPDVDDILSHSSSGFSTPSSFVFMDEEMFSGNQPTSIPSPILSRANKYGQGGEPQIEVEIEEIEVTGQQYASMLSYSSSMNVLEGIKEEEEEESDEGSEEDSYEEEKEREERDRQEREEQERQKKEREEQEREEEKRKKAEREKEEEIRKRNEEILSKNFNQKRSSLRKSSSEMRLQEERLAIDDQDYVTATGTLRRRLIRRTPSVAVINETETAKAVMAQLSIQEQKEIAMEQERLEEEHKVFEKEVNQWDDTSNDIIVLAKEICWMAMDMSDFLRGEGELLTTMDVVNTAKDITVAAKKLIELAQLVADLAPDGSNKKDLLAYLDRIKLFCNQLKITSGVLSDLDKVRETADNFNNLLISAKSLMNTVVLVVKGCYVASNAIKRRGGKLPIKMLQWRMMKPKKKRLYSDDASNKEDPRNKEMSPIIALGDFRGRHSVLDGNEDTLTRLTMEEKIRKMKRHRL